MAEQTTLSIAEEAAERQRTADAAEFEGFLQQWTLDDMPFCPEGMKLLLDLSKRQPSLYERARKRFFVDLEHAAYAFTELGRHVGLCRDCNER